MKRHLLFLENNILFLSTSQIFDLHVHLRHLHLMLLYEILLYIWLIFVCLVLPILLTDTDYWIDYGVFGVLLTVAIYYAPKKLFKILLSLPLLIAITLYSNSIQWFSLLSLPLLTLYNGKRGKYNIKWLFYIFYPAHLLVIQLIDWLIIRY